MDKVMEKLPKMNKAEMVMEKVMGKLPKRT